MKRAVYSIIAALAAVVSLSAQEFSHFAFQAGAGFTEPVGRTGYYHDVGYNTSTGFGYNFDSHVGVLIDMSFTSLGINSTTLNTIGVPGGNVNVFSATLDPIIHLMPHRRVDVYFTGGAGEYRREQIFVAPLFTTPIYGGIPYFGLVPSNSLVTSSSVNKLGWDFGVGIAGRSKGRGKYYAELRYHKLDFNSQFHMDYENITFGYRW